MNKLGLEEKRNIRQERNFSESYRYRIEEVNMVQKIYSDMRGRKMILKSTLLFFLFLSPFFLFSQTKIKGQVLTSDGNSIEFATIQLQTKDGVLLVSDVSDENGFFQIEKEQGEYLFKIFYLGNELFKKEISLIDDVDLGRITIDYGIELKEIMIESKLKMKRNFDKYEVTNISNSVLAKNKSTLEFLNTVPIVNVTPDGKSIKIKNSKSVLVLINGRNVGGNDVAMSMLQSIPAIDIKKIEVIENPGSGYRAGDNGIINVIVNKTKEQPFKVVLNAKSTQSFYNTQDGSAYLAFSKNKWAVTSGVKLENSKYKAHRYDSYTDFKSNEETQIESNAITKGTNYTPYVNIDYTLSKNQTIGMSFSSRFSNNEANRDIVSSYYNITNNQLDSLNIAKNKDKISNYHVVYYNLNHKIILDTLDSNINSDFNYYNSRNNRDMFNVFAYANGKEKRFIQNPDNTAELIEFKTEYEKNFKDSSKLTTGINYSKSNIKSDNFFGNYNGVEYISDDRQTNVFKYKEDYFALFANYRKLFSETFGVLIGLRYEYLSADGTLKSDSETVKISNSNLFPSVALLYGISDEHQLTLNFASSITRTPYSNLNPFIYINSPNSIRVNNPYLKNTKKSFIGLTYTFFDDYNLELGYAKTHNLFNNFDAVIDNVIVNTIDNYGNGDGYGGNFYFNKNLFKNYWSFSFSMSLEMSKIKGEYNNIPIKIDNTNFYFNIKNNLFFDKKKNTVLTLTYGYDNGFEDVFGKVNAQHSLSVDFGKSFNDFYISIGAYDLLRPDTNMRFSNSAYSFNKKQEYFKSYFINMRYTLGNKRIKNVISKEQNERLN
ncbi:TonB-dependent receptor domain-containing protein [Myroides odoratimimus]|uniref:TonB-dependent receptor domain-containing protein n=1 Tax=Myroides odoratimimus TaxID=76832 RepID=UPI002DBDA76C|nr:TonB-dependent receptor [Myroides odoratimimus]MEC4093997.1 TonB-dependent receptor [Myroides odoratimimus]